MFKLIINTTSSHMYSAAKEKSKLWIYTYLYMHMCIYVYVVPPLTKDEDESRRPIKLFHLG